MSDVLDAYSVHIYWDYWDTPFFMELRLKDVRADRDRGAAGRGAQADVHHGVRRPRHPQLPGQADRRARLLGGRNTDIARTNIAAFQQLWFDLASAQLGFTGLGQVGRVLGQVRRNVQLVVLPDRAGRQRDGRSSRRTTRLRLLLQTTQRGLAGAAGVEPWEEDDWKVGVRRPAREGDRRVRRRRRAADADGPRLARPRPERRSPPSRPRTASAGCRRTRTFNLVALERDRRTARTRSPARSRPNAAGVARFEVPLHAAFALTTVPVS